MVLGGVAAGKADSLGKSIAVVYPQAPDPYRAVFDEIIAGIEQRAGTAGVRRYTLSEKTDPAALKQGLQEQSAKAVITLGSLATRTYEATGLTIPQVIGALDLSPQTRPQSSGISLAVDPHLLFSTLKRLAPKIKRVFVVFDPARDRWIIDQARRAASTQDLILLALEAADLRTSSQHFIAIFKNADPNTDAIWLTINSQLVDTEVVLPEIVAESWRRRLVVFSSNLAHADLGVLFALFPANQALGQHLADMALRWIENPNEKPSIEPLRDVKRALNLRLAAHLSLAIDRATESQFDLVFPAR